MNIYGSEHDESNCTHQSRCLGSAGELLKGVETPFLASLRSGQLPAPSTTETA